MAGIRRRGLLRVFFCGIIRQVIEQVFYRAAKGIGNFTQNLEGAGIKARIVNGTAQCVRCDTRQAAKLTKPHLAHCGPDVALEFHALVVTKYLDKSTVTI
nr:MAG TPA: hypothetical protein [Bacteriophage sp.]